MELKDSNGNFVMIDHPKFDPVFDFLIENNIPLIGHLGEPKNCWLPIKKMTVKGDVNYFSAHPEYHMYLHPEYPSYQDQIDARDRMLGRHPDLQFIGAHLGSLEWSINELAKRLDRFPDMAVDTAERISHLQLQAISDWQKVHEFFIKYQDRIIYGTDIIVDETKSPLKMKKHAHDIRLRHWKFFTSDEMMSVPKVDSEFKGLKLPREVVDKIYRTNAEKWFSKAF
jgi:predicted TIM-barrel fold metal-dependent hydrolase